MRSYQVGGTWLILLQYEQLEIEAEAEIAELCDFEVESK